MSKKTNKNPNTKVDRRTHCVVEFVELGVAPEDEPFLLPDLDHDLVNLETRRANERMSKGADWTEAKRTEAKQRRPLRGAPSCGRRRAP